MLGDAFADVGRAANLAVALLLICLPLAVWKAVEIVVWAVSLVWP